MKFLLKQMNSIERRAGGRKTYYDAQNYTSTDPVSGRRQADLRSTRDAVPNLRSSKLGAVA